MPEIRHRWTAYLFSLQVPVSRSLPAIAVFEGEFCKFIEVREFTVNITFWDLPCVNWKRILCESSNRHCQISSIKQNPCYIFKKREKKLRDSCSNCPVIELICKWWMVYIVRLTPCHEFSLGHFFKSPTGGSFSLSAAGLRQRFSTVTARLLWEEVRGLSLLFL